MPTLQYVGNAGRFRLTGSGVDVAQGETVTVDADTAEYLQANGEFEVVNADDDDDESDEGTADVAAPIDPGNYTVSELEAKLDDSEFSDAELKAIRSAEAQGQNRKGVRGALDGRVED